MRKRTRKLPVSPWLIALLMVVLGLCAYTYWGGDISLSQLTASQPVGKVPTVAQLLAVPKSASQPRAASAVPPSKKRASAAAEQKAKVSASQAHARTSGAGSKPTSSAASSPAHAGAPATAQAKGQVAAKGKAASAPVLKIANLFSVPPPPPPPPPVKPVAPPLPFSVESVWGIDNEPVVSLRMNGALYLVCAQCRLDGAIKPGGNIAGLYQLKHISPTMLEFIYLPLKQPQQLALNNGPM